MTPFTPTLKRYHQGWIYSQREIKHKNLVKRGYSLCKCDEEIHDRPVTFQSRWSHALSPTGKFRHWILVSLLSGNLSILLIIANRDGQVYCFLVWLIHPLTKDSCHLEACDLLKDIRAQNVYFFVCIAIYITMYSLLTKHTAKVYYRKGNFRCNQMSCSWFLYLFFEGGGCIIKYDIAIYFN